MKLRTLRSRGQAVIWLLGTLAASAAVMYAVFNTSQITVGKERAVNAADAAALAGATTEARLLNLMAYANRGVVANEVFLAQLLSMESWVQYLGRTSGNIGTLLDVLSLIPPAAPFTKPAAMVMDKISTIADKAHSGIQKGVNVFIPILEGVKTGLKAAEGAIRIGGALLAQDAAKHMVSANRTDFGGRFDPGVVVASTKAVNELTFLKNNTDWVKFTKLYEKGDRNDGKYILEQSIDRFTASRPGAGWLNLSVFFFGLEKHGGSQLQGLDRWESEDTLESWEKYWCKVKWCKSYQPIGWGRANADKDGTMGSTWAPNRWAQDLAYENGGTHSKWTGVPALYDVADKSKAARETLGLDFVVAVSRAGSNDFTTTSVPMGSELKGSVLGSPHMPLKQEASQNTAFAKARVFFERPRSGLAKDSTASALWRPDGAKEYGSLYSPYWQARLRDLTQGEKAALLLAMGISPDKVFYTPGGQS